MACTCVTFDSLVISDEVASNTSSANLSTDGDVDHQVAARLAQSNNVPNGYVSPGVIPNAQACAPAGSHASTIGSNARACAPTGTHQETFAPLGDASTVCFNCGIVGHLRHHCSARRDDDDTREIWRVITKAKARRHGNNTAKARALRKRNPAYRPERSCHNCGARDHLFRDCTRGLAGDVADIKKVLTMLITQTMITQTAPTPAMAAPTAAPAPGGFIDGWMNVVSCETSVPLVFDTDIIEDAEHVTPSKFVQGKRTKAARKNFARNERRRLRRANDVRRGSGSTCTGLDSVALAATTPSTTCLCTGARRTTCEHMSMERSVSSEALAVANQQSTDLCSLYDKDVLIIDTGAGELVSPYEGDFVMSSFVEPCGQRVVAAGNEKHAVAKLGRLRVSCATTGHVIDSKSLQLGT
jgi:hypothetical protein